ncbi:MAG: HTTM domain-containing protein [Planctomycetota bacterium]
MSASQPVPSPAADDSQNLSLGALKRNAGRFFFAEEIPYGPAAARIAIATPMLYEAVRRWPHARELYSADGAPSSLWHTYGLPDLLPELPGWAAVGLFSVYTFAVFTALIGWSARLSCAIAAAGCFYFCNLDMTGSLTKYTVVATHMFLLLSLSRCGAVWSVDAVVARRAAERRGECWAPPRAPAWSRRLLQLLIGIVYFGAAFTKLHMDEFFNGDQMTYWMVTHVNRVHPLGPFFATNPVLLLIGAYATCFWEMTFVMMAWKGWGRRLWLTAGVLFHLATTLSLGLFIFPLVSWAAYWAFLSERDVAAVKQRFARLKQALTERVPGFARAASFIRTPRLGLSLQPPTLRWGYLVAAPAIAVLGMGAEQGLDPYGERGPDGPAPLKTIDPALVRAMTAPVRPPQPVDQLWDFDLGRLLVGENLLGRGDQFANDEQILAQAWLSPPHDDAALECIMHYADGPDGVGPALARQKAVLLREQSRHAFVWGLDESVAPGPYRMSLLIDGVHVADEYFTVTAP